MADDLQRLRDCARQIAPFAASLRELCGDDDLAFADTLDGETDAIRAASQAVRIVAAMEAMAEAANGLAQRYSARSGDFEKRAEKARDALAHFMGEIGEKTLVLPEGTVSLAKGARSLKGDASLSDVPIDYIIVPPAPPPRIDRAAVKKALESGETIPGFELSNGPPSLRIRTR